MRSTSGAAVTALLVLLLAACGTASATHRATVLERPTQGEGDAARDNWIVLVRLRDTTVAGTDTVYVGFTGSELACADGTRLDPTDLPPRAELRFVRVDGDADTMDPPAIRGVQLRAACTGSR